MKGLQLPKKTVINEDRNLLLVKKHNLTVAFMHRAVSLQTVRVPLRLAFSSLPILCWQTLTKLLLRLSIAPFQTTLCGVYIDIFIPISH